MRKAFEELSQLAGVSGFTGFLDTHPSLNERWRNAGDQCNPYYVYARIDEVDKLPFTSEKAKAEYKRYLASALPKAFAISTDKKRFAWRSTAQGTREAIARALARCAELAGEPCRLYAVNDDVVWNEHTAEGRSQR